MTSLMEILGLASLWSLGLLITPRLGSFHPATRLGMAYGIGTVGVTLVLGAMGLVGLPISSAVALPTVAVLAACLWVVRRWVSSTGQTFHGATEGETRIRMATRWSGFGVAGALGLLVAAIIAALTLLRTWIRPITGWDVWAVYAVKAKMIYATEAIPLGLLGTVNTPNYPLGPSIQQVWAALVAGSWSETAIKLTAWGYFPSMGLVAYGALRGRFAPGAALLGALFVSTLPLMVQHSQEPYANLPLAYFVLGQGVALTHYGCTRSRHGLFVAAVFGMGTVLTRVEGALFVILNTLLLTYVKMPWRDRLAYLGPAAVVWGVWAAVRPRSGFETVLISDLSIMSTSLDRVAPVAAAFGQSLFMSGNWMIVWTLFFVAFLLRFRSTFDVEHIFLVWPVVMYLGVFAGIFVTKEWMYRYLDDQTLLHRLILHVAPLAALWVAFLICAGSTASRANQAGQQEATDVV